MTPIPSEPAGLDVPRTSGPTLRGALLWAVVGAALFLGVGAALPAWRTGEVVYAHVRLQTGLREDHVYVRYAQVALWRAIHDRVRPPLEPPVPGLWGDLGAEVVVGPSCLLAGGTLAGLLNYIATLRLRRRKGGGA